MSDVSAPRRWLGPALVALAQLPSVAWVSLDRSVWSWDQAWYGYNSVNLWRTLRSEPGSWPAAMETAMTDRAAGVCWLGQWFVPLGERLGSIDAGLGLSVVATQLATLLVLWGVGRRLAPEAGWRVPLAGCLLAAGAPLFVGLSHQFYVEPLQTLAVAWIYYLALAGRSLSRLQTFTQLLAASALGIAAKVSTPLYCFLPGLVVLCDLWPRREPRRSRRQTLLDLGCLAAAAALTYLTVRWYLVNWETTFAHVREASAGETALHFGRRDTFGNKLLFWLREVRSNLFTVKAGWPAAVVGLTGAAFWAARKCRRRWQTSLVERRDVLALLALLQLAAVLTCFATTINDDTRYLLPSLPSLAVLVMWSVAEARGRWAWTGWALVAVLLLQWAAMNAITFGWLERPDNVSAYVAPLNRDAARAREAERLLDRLTADERTERQCSVFGSEQLWLNNTTAAYLNGKRQLAGKRPVNLTALPENCSDGERAFRFVEDSGALYVIFVTDAQDPPAFFNRAAGPLLEQIQRHKQFVAEPFPSEQGVLVFRRVAGGAAP
jgi:hypothetical protein